MKTSVEKTIFFGIIDWRYKNKMVDALDIVSKIENLSFDDGRRYLENSEGQRLGVIFSKPVTNGMTSIYGCIGDSRTTNLPFLEKKGTLTPLKISKDTGIFDAMHFLLRKNKNGKWIVAYEFNLYAPRIYSLCSYVRSKFPNDVDLTLVEPITGQKVTEIMKNFQHLKKIRMGIHSGANIDNLSPVLGGALREIEKEQNGGLIEMTFSVRYKKDTPLNGNVVDNIVPFFKTSDPQISMEYFYVQGLDKRTGSIEKVNLMDIVLKEKRQVEKMDTDHRFINPAKMYEALDDAYNRNQTKLDKI